MFPLMVDDTTDRLLTELSPRLRSFLERSVRDAGFVEDLLQETLLKVAGGLEGFEGKSKIQTWAWTIATRVIADHYRRQGRQIALLDLEASPDPVDPDCDIHQRLIVDEMNACIRDVIEALPDDYRDVLVLHDLEGMTAKDCAEIKGCTLAVAKIRIHRARKKLQEALSQACEFYQDDDSVLRCDRKPGDAQG